MLHRTFATSVCAAALFLTAPAAQAAPKKSSACIEAWKNADTLIKEGQLRKAKPWMHKCAATTCPANIQRECAAKSTQLGIDIPTVVLSITEKSDLLSDVEVTMDGEVLVSKIDGRAVQVDPGLHEFVFTADDGAVVRQKLVIQQGQRNRAVAVSFAGAEPHPLAKSKAPPAAAEEPSPVKPGKAAPETEAVVSRRVTEEPRGRRRDWMPTPAVYALGGVGVLGVTGFALMSTWGRRDDQILLRNCSPDCKPESIDHIRKLYLASKISLGVGVAALGAGAYLYMRSWWSRSGEVASAGSRRYVLQVVPTAEGGWAGLTGSF